ncbi:MAG: stage II sporulation protein P [Bacillota bacterium]|nr:stage II sporulation protein P [Bacillota bacterium]MDW7683654.1 stage II sporulation protein P [Bacillota bacterium]
MKRIIFPFVVAIVLGLALTATSLGQESATTRSLLEFFDHQDTGEISRDDMAADRYYTMVDEHGREITVTGRKIHVGDEYITSDNKLYRVYRVQERIAHARFIREVGVFYEEEPQGIFVMLRKWVGFGVRPVQTNQEEEPGDIEGLPEPEDEPKRLIGIYHTHNAESYVPTDGTDSINGEGGIHNVGLSFTDALEEKGITVLHDETLHLPHDRGAYRRSRVTAEKLLAKGPDATFDVHRDAAPMRVYAVEIEEDWVTQVQFVVGRQNPNMNVTRQFALDLKNTADEIHPDLVKGIFMARGNYNQDLTPMNLLLEVGAHQNTREAAEDGISLFADVVSFYFYGETDENGEQAAPAPGARPAQPPPGAQTGPAARAANRSIISLLGLSLFIIVGFLFINAVSFEDIRFRLAPYLERLRLLNERIGRFLAPRMTGVLPFIEKGDRFLEPLQERIRNIALFVAEQTVRGLQYGDGVLIVWQGKIRETAMLIRKKTGMALQQGDRFVEPWQGKVRDTSLLFGGRSRLLLENGDRYLAMWQEKIRDLALTVKETIQRLYLQIRDRDRLR